MKIIGVYMWNNKINDKKYIGVSNDIYKRWNQHINISKSGKKRKFYNAIRKYGVENFEMIILERYPKYDKNELKNRENYFIEFYDSINNGYNIEKEYNTITDNPNIENIKKIISEKAKNRKWINNGKKQITCDINEINDYLNNGWVYGRIPFDEKHKEQLSISHIGYSPTDETRKKLSDLWLGRNHTQKTKDMMSEKLMGRYTINWYIDKYGEEIGKVKHELHHKKSIDNNTGCVCVNKDGKNKMIKKDLLEEYIKNNWIKGRFKK